MAAWEQPVLLLWGEDDRLVPVAVAERLNDAIPASTLGLVPDSGHLLLDDAFASVGEMIVEYLRARYLRAPHDHGGITMLQLERRPAPDRPRAVRAGRRRAGADRSVAAGGGTERMTRARLFLSGIEADGRHGARSGEKDAPQPFVVDLDLEVNVGEDRIDGTADYRDGHRAGPRRRGGGLVRPDRVDGRGDRARVPHVRPGAARHRHRAQAERRRSDSASRAPRRR